MIGKDGLRDFCKRRIHKRVKMVVGLVKLTDALYGYFGTFRYFPHAADKLAEDLDQKVEGSSTDVFHIAFKEHQNNRSSENSVRVFVQN